MKAAALKSIALAIIFAIILISVIIYYILRTPDTRYGTIKYITNFSLERRIRRGEMSEKSGIQLKKAFNRFFQAQIELEKSQLDRKKIEKEIEEMLESKNIRQHWEIKRGEKLTDDEVKQLIIYLNEVSQKIEESLENSAANSQ